MWRTNFSFKLFLPSAIPDDKILPDLHRIRFKALKPIQVNEKNFRVVTTKKRENSQGLVLRGVIFKYTIFFYLIN